MGDHVRPPSALDSKVKFDSTTPVPCALAVQVIGMDGPLKTPPVGEVMFTSGWSRSNPVGEVLTSQRRAASRNAARVGLAGFRFVAVESTPVISNAKYARRDGVPPQVPCPAVPFEDEDTQRRPIG